MKPQLGVAVVSYSLLSLDTIYSHHGLWMAYVYSHLALYLAVQIYSAACV